MHLTNHDPPILLIIAGPNGSGKSSSYENTEFERDKRTIWIVNPDLLSLRIEKTEGLPQEQANLVAVQRIEQWLNSSVSVHKSVGVETVLSTDKYRKLVCFAKELGFEIWLIYVVLDSVEKNIERVQIRVRKGGHSVPEEKIRARYARSFEQFPWFIEKADIAWVYDNSGSSSKLVVEKRNGVIAIAPKAPEAIKTAIKAIADD